MRSTLLSPKPTEVRLRRWIRPGSRLWGPLPGPGGFPARLGALWALEVDSNVLRGKIPSQHDSEPPESVTFLHFNREVFGGGTRPRESARCGAGDPS